MGWLRPRLKNIIGWAALGLAGLACLWLEDVFTWPRLLPVAGPGRLSATLRVQVDAAGVTRAGQGELQVCGGIWVTTLRGEAVEQGLQTAALLHSAWPAADRAWILGQWPESPEILQPVFQRLLWLRRRDELGTISEPLQGMVRGWAAAMGKDWSWHPWARRQLTYWLSEETGETGQPETDDGRGIVFGIRRQLTLAGHPLLAQSFGCAWAAQQRVSPVVARVFPESGQPYLAITWPGWLGAVSGCNQAGIGLAMLTGVPEAAGPNRGEPGRSIVERVLRQATTLAAAVQLLQETRSQGSHIFAVGSGEENKFIIVEKTPQRMATWYDRDSWVAASNDFVTPQLSETPAYRNWRSRSTAEGRRARTSALLRRTAGRLDPAACAAILRDRRDPAGAPLALGHAAGIEALTTGVAAVFDLTARQVWLSRGPCALGEFVGVALDPAAPALPPARLGPDPLLLGADWAHWAAYRSGLEQGRTLMRSQHYQGALAGLQDIRPLNPDDYRLYWLMAESLAALQRQDEARYNFAEALRLHPATAAERDAVERELKRFSAEQP